MFWKEVHKKGPWTRTAAVETFLWIFLVCFESVTWALPCSPQGIKSYVKQCQKLPKTFLCSRCIPQGIVQGDSPTSIPSADPWDHHSSALAVLASRVWSLWALTLLCPSNAFLPFQDPSFQMYLTTTQLLSLWASAGVLHTLGDSISII